MSDVEDKIKEEIAENKILIYGKGITKGHATFEAKVPRVGA